MRLSLILPPVQPAVYPAVETCPSAECGGGHFQPWQAVPKPLRDTLLTEVVAHRYRCVRCGRTFRLYPQGVSHDQASARLKGVAVLVYVLGMSYGAVATALTAWVQDLAAVLGATILVSDDADPFKTAADAVGLLQQVCTAHVLRNTAAWVEAIAPALHARRRWLAGAAQDPSRAGPG